MIANGILQTTTGTGVAGAALALAPVPTLPTFASKFSAGTYGDPILFGVKRADSGAFAFAGVGRLTDANTLTVDRVLSTWDGTAADDTSPAAVALAAGVAYYVYPTLEAGAAVGAIPTVAGDLSGSTDSRRVLLGPGLGAILSGSTQSLTANFLYSWPARWSCLDTIKRLYLGITTAVAGGSVRVMIFDMRHDGTPGGLRRDSGPLSTAAATLVGATIPEYRPPLHGFYVAVVSDSGISVRSYSPTDPGVRGWASGSVTTFNGFAQSSRNFGLGAPDPMPAPTILQSATTAAFLGVWGGV